MPRSRLRLLLPVVAVILGVSGPLVAASPSSARPMGGQPLDDIVAAANAAARPDCSLSGARLAALMIPPTYPETGATGSVPPSPMTLSRWDLAPGLFFNSDPNTPYSRAFFNPGVGMWQFDSAGLGRPHAASYFMNTQTAAPAAAATMAQRWCFAWARPSTYPTDSLRMAYVWDPWHACDKGYCHQVFLEIFNGTSLVNLVRFEAVTRTGGMQHRSCQDLGSSAVLDCYWVNPALAEGYGAGSVAWANPNRNSNNSNSPLSAPFYVYEFAGKEYRHWLAADTGYPADILAVRPLSGNARTSLTWSTGPALCDLSQNRGACVPPPPLGPNRPVTASHPSIVGQGRGVGLVSLGDSLMIAERRSDGVPRFSSYNAPFWSGWTYMDGVAMSDVEAAGWGTDHLELFTRGADGAIWRNVVEGGLPAGWTSLGGSFTSGPAVVSWAPGRVDVFGRGLDGGLWASYISDGVFSGWYPLGGVIIADPEVASWGPNRLDIFAVGSDRQLWHIAWNGSAFTPWESWGGTITSSPAATSAAPDRIDVAGRGVNGAVYVRHWNGTNLLPWATIGGVISSAPDLAAATGGSSVLVARGQDGNLYRATRDSSGVWSGWARTP